MYAQTQAYAQADQAIFGETQVYVDGYGTQQYQAVEELATVSSAKPNATGCLSGDSETELRGSCREKDDKRLIGEGIEAVWSNIFGNFENAQRVKFSEKNLIKP